MISVIIPCYWASEDLREMTKNCLDTLWETAGPNLHEVIVVDDGSPLKYRPFNVEIVSLPENRGYAGAVNAGLRWSEGDILVVSNNDIEFVDPNWLNHLTAPLNMGYGISSIRTTDSDGWLVEDRITEGDKFGSIWAMTREVYAQLGGLDESFGKGYFEDLDFKKRAEDAGFKVAKNHAGIVEHRGKATFGTVDPDDNAFTRARALFKEKWGEVW